MIRHTTRHIFFAILVIIGLFWLSVLYAQLTLPNVDLLKSKNPATTAFMERFEGDKPLQYRWVPYSSISPYLKEAVVVAEDGSFFVHHGFDWHAIRDAFEKNWRKKGLVRGGSTLTQQLAKNLYLSPSKNPFRKLKEILITLQLEQNLSKQRILELYLNVVEWGDGIYGAEAAAKHYFGVKASQLNASQSAWLAAALPNPRYYEKHRDGAFIQRKAGKIAGIMSYKAPPKPAPQKPVDGRFSERSEREGGQGGETPSSGRRQTAATVSENLPLEGATQAPVDIYDDMPYEEQVEEF